MKTSFVCLLSALALLLVSTGAGRADQFDRIGNSPYTYWVPAPTPPPPGYVAQGAPPPRYYYGPPPSPGPVFFIPRFFIGFRFH